MHPTDLVRAKDQVIAAQQQTIEARQKTIAVLEARLRDVEHQVTEFGSFPGDEGIPNAAHETTPSAPPLFHRPQPPAA